MNKKDFLNYIDNVITNEKAVFFNQEKQMFYFYINNTLFYLCSNQSNVWLEVIEERKGQKISENINLTLEEAIPLINKCIINIDKVENSYIEEKIIEFGKKDFDGAIIYIKEYLKNTDLSKEVEHLINNHIELEEYKHNIYLNEMEHLCRIGRLAKYTSKKEYLLTSFAKLPIFLNCSKNKIKNSFYYELLIPAYELNQYPVFNFFVEDKVCRSDDFNTKINRICNTYADGKLLMSGVLNLSLHNSLDKKDVKTKKSKI